MRYLCEGVDPKRAEDEMMFCDQQPARVGNLMNDNMIVYCVWASRESVPTEAGNFTVRDGGFVFSW